MKKIFSILGAVLVSLAMHATVVTKTVDWQLEKQGSSKVEGNVITAKAWSGAEKWNWLTGASQYDQLVLEVADHTENIQFKAIFSDGTNDVSPASVRVLPSGFNEIAVDVTADVLHYIEVQNMSGTDDVEITINRIYLRGAIGEKEDPIVLWSGSNTFNDWNWNQRELIAPEKFNDLHVGDIVEVAYTTNAESYHQIQIKFEYDNTYPKFSPFQIDLGGSSESGVLRFCITNEDDLTDIASKGGIYLDGKYITFTKVSVIKHDVLWTGMKTADWSTAEIPASSFSSVTVGDILNIRLTSAVSGSQVELLKGNWGKFTPHLWYFFNSAPESLPTTIQYVLNQSTVDDLQANGLIARGATSYTMTDIYLTTAAATTTSYDLTVSAAGMATLVLPFKVLSLPSGVKAYTLSMRESDHAIMADEVDVIEADQPVLIVAEAGVYTFDSELGGDDNISGKSWWSTVEYAEGVLIGNYRSTHNPGKSHVSSEVTYYHYLLQNGAGGVGFYQVGDADCSIDSYRAYLSIAYDKANDNGGSSSAPKMRLVFRHNAPTGVESAQTSVISSQKVLRDGQILILRDNKEYNVFGQQL